MRIKFPVFTLTVLLLSLIGSAWPAAVQRLIYDRQAILDGELWRLLSGHLVHFSLPHLTADLLVFTFAGTLIEQQLGPKIVWLYLAMSTAIGLALLLLEPDLARFGGLSGLAYGSVFYLTLSTTPNSGIANSTAMAILAGLLLKISIDFARPSPLIIWTESQPIITVPLSHLAGMLVAGIYCITRARTRRTSVEE